MIMKNMKNIMNKEMNEEEFEKFLDELFEEYI